MNEKTKNDVCNHPDQNYQDYSCHRYPIIGCHGGYFTEVDSKYIPDCKYLGKKVK